MPIEIKNITKDYGDTRALDNVSLTLGENKIYGLLGNNGAGKSTLLSILTDRQRATSGAAMVDGETVVNNDFALQKVFLVSEQNLFPDEMKVNKAFKSAKIFYPDFDIESAKKLSQKFGLNTKKKIKSLSTGYASIFRLILGLCVNAPYLFLDEPVLGLDAQHRDMFYRSLLEKYAERPCTIVISTHLIAEAANLIEHAIIIRSGRILKDCPSEELTSTAYSVSGPIGLVDKYAEGKRVLSTNILGGLKSACIYGQCDKLPEGLEFSSVNLQDYFISLMEEEDKK